MTWKVALSQKYKQPHHAIMVIFLCDENTITNLPDIIVSTGLQNDRFE